MSWCIITIMVHKMEGHWDWPEFITLWGGGAMPSFCLQTLFFSPLYLIVGASHVSLTCIQLVPCLFLILSLSLLFIRLPAQPVFTPASSYLLPLFSCSCVQFLVCFWACSWLFGFTASQTEINLLFIHPAYVSSVLILIPVFFCACVCSQMLTSIIKDIN